MSETFDVLRDGPVSVGVASSHAPTVSVGLKHLKLKAGSAGLEGEFAEEPP